MNPQPPHLQDHVDPTTLRPQELLERRIWLTNALRRIETQLGEPQRTDRSNTPMPLVAYRQWRSGALRALGSVSRELQLVRGELRARHAGDGRLREVAIWMYELLRSIDEESPLGLTKKEEVLLRDAVHVLGLVITNREENVHREVHKEAVGPNRPKEVPG